MPVYGDGSNVRDWLFVDDHARALATILMRGRPGEKYNVGGRNERRNIDIVQRISEFSPDRTKRLAARKSDRIRARPARSRSALCNTTRANERELGWRAKETFDTGIEKTVAWYCANEWWWRPLRDLHYSGERLGLLEAAENVQ